LARETFSTLLSFIVSLHHQSLFPLSALARISLDRRLSLLDLASNPVYDAIAIVAIQQSAKEGPDELK